MYMLFNQCKTFLRTVSIGLITRASKRNFARQNKTDLGPQGQAETSLQLRI